MEMVAGGLPRGLSGWIVTVNDHVHAVCVLCVHNVCVQYCEECVCMIVQLFVHLLYTICTVFFVYNLCCLYNGV